MYKVSLILPCFNEMEHIENSLKRIYDLEEEYEMILYREYDYKHLNLTNKQFQSLFYLADAKNIKMEQSLLLYISPNVKYYIFDTYIVQGRG